MSGSKGGALGCPAYDGDYSDCRDDPKFSEEVGLSIVEDLLPRKPPPARVLAAAR